jgi:hypothetical protein
MLVHSARAVTLIGASASLSASRIMNALTTGLMT